MTNHLSLSGTKGFPGMHPGAKTRAVPAQANLMIDHLNSVPDRGKRKNKGPEMRACLVVSGPNTEASAAKRGMESMI